MLLAIRCSEDLLMFLEPHCERKIKLWHVISTSLWAAVSDAVSLVRGSYTMCFSVPDPYQLHFLKHRRKWLLIVECQPMWYL
ncbi:hypothetical protein CHARACLAT_015975 [Characodon lateralis]|uniref:Uncharacterized protein n=1 Tax=Characodon lateralis TaxID=208331 RepID=A0ABU7DH73_9TELE|nr:hypothetical protein [Characodon lateralis]